MKKVDIQEVTRFINKLEEKFNALDINNEVVRGNVAKDFAVVKEVLRKNPSEERIIEGLKLFLNGLRDYSYGNKNLNPLIYNLEEYIKEIDITSDY
jgi:type III secretory pathway component EscV